MQSAVQLFFVSPSSQMPSPQTVGLLWEQSAAQFLLLSPVSQIELPHVGVSGGGVEPGPMKQSVAQLLTFSPSSAAQKPSPQYPESQQVPYWPQVDGSS